MLARVFILSLTIPHLLWAKVNCDELNAIHKIEAYRTCQTNWTAGICGLALGHLTASAIKDSTRNALLKLAKDNSTILASEHWDVLRKRILENFVDTGNELVNEISSLQKEHARQIAFFKDFSESELNNFINLIFRRRK